MRKPVVGAAIVRDARVLAARRTTPPALAGRWEFPGGKVEAGERPSDALARELLEELGCTIEVTGWLDGTAEIGSDYELSVATAVLLDGGPVPSEHDLIRWLGADELDAVDWLEPDRPFLPELRSLLLAAGRRAVFFDEDHARGAAARLRQDGHDARVERERLAGEDDDEDHPWAVVTDAPQLAVELLVDEYDGWLDVGDHPPPEAPLPLPLPTQPRRVKRPPTDA
jgi:mutator protein MutT